MSSKPGIDIRKVKLVDYATLHEVALKMWSEEVEDFPKCALVILLRPARKIWQRPDIWNDLKEEGDYAVFLRRTVDGFSASLVKTPIDDGARCVDRNPLFVVKEKSAQSALLDVLFNAMGHGMKMVVGAAFVWYSVGRVYRFLEAAFPV